MLTQTRRIRRLLIFAFMLWPVPLLGLFLAGSTATATTTPASIGPCSVFPANNIWNTRVDLLPVDARSQDYVNSIGANAGLHPDFGAGLWEGAPIGISYTTVTGAQPSVNIVFTTWGDESDPGPYPIPTNAPIEGGSDADGDRHVLVVNLSDCRLYELFYAWPQPDGSWEAKSGAIFNLASHTLRPDTWTSADAAGLPMVPGLVRYDEVTSGAIQHALRFTAPVTRRAYVWPARHYASDQTSLNLPPMGQRFRLKASFDISGFSPANQVILTALKTYGMFLADNGGPWFLSGVPDERWDNDDLHELQTNVRGSDFEAVDSSSLMLDINSGEAAPPGQNTPTRTPTPTATLISARWYLPLLAKVHASPPPVPTQTPAATATPTRTPTAVTAATATPTRTPTAVAAATATPTATGTALVPDLFVDDDNTTGTETGSAQYPFNTVQEAINAAGNGDIIAVAGGLYAGNVRVQDKTVHLYGGFVGGTAANYASGAGGNFSSRNPTANPTHLQGDQTDATVNLLNAGTSTLDGFRITNGTRSVEELPWAYRGGGVYVSGGAPTIAHNVIKDNDTRTAAPAGEETVGGGIYASDANITIRNNTIRNNTAGRGAGIAVGGGTALIQGNTVQGNIGVSDHGGGLYIASPSVTVTQNRIIGNEIGRDLGYGWGGGIIIFNEGSVATLSGNIITGNYAPSVGAGVFIDDGAQAVLDHELIYNNECAENGGAGIYVDGYDVIGSHVTIRHSTIASHNCTPNLGGNGLYIEAHSVVTVTNSIFWGHGGDDFWLDDTSTLTVMYTTAQEAMAGPGNLAADPLFADAANHDYHLRSTAGRWNPAANGGNGGWVVDAQHSPAIDAGDPTAAYANEPAPNGGRVNMGVYGNTAEASKSNAVLRAP